MDFFVSLKISASGLRAQAARMRVVAENIANASSTGKTPSDDPYRRRVPTFTVDLDRQTGAQMVRSGRTFFDKKPFDVRFDPGNPAADESGYVKISNVNTLIETADMLDAQRSYEANLSMIGATRSMFSHTLDILRI
ncbi:MAG: flagellar basal body rod protein FlgC [Alphaproteobacteria bacterium]|nr:flagellar basal body rod protein FlgC [Alphaproteobacteria bacterium]